MKFLVAFFCVAALALSSEASKVRYDGYKVYRVDFKTEEQFNLLYKLDLESQEVMFWQLVHSEHYADIMVAPQKVKSFLAFLDAHGLTYEVMIDDVQKTMEEEGQA